MSINESAAMPAPRVTLPSPGRGTAWFLLFAVVYLVATLIYFAGLGIYMAVSQPGVGPEEVEAMIHGNLVAHIPGMYLTQFICLLPLILLASRFSTQTISQTLSIKPVKLRLLAIWLGVYALYQIAAIALHSFLNIPMDDFTQQIATQRNLATILTLVVLAPVLEELVFRGYLFKAWRHSWLGASGTIMLTSVLFLGLHLGQYGALVMGQLFIFAIILGIAREKTGSIITPWLLHTANNLFSAILLMYLGWA
ncbi:MAG TPA: CPBP family intramembrane glutamic endopeptidase [Cellvibrionaceae bacterium]